MRKTAKTTAECPECNAEIESVEGVLMNEILTCEDCGAELEVTSTQPFQLELAPEVEEDWGE
jgi:alpha-aminoadipate carrier protein LysW